MSQRCCTWACPIPLGRSCPTTGLAPGEEQTGTNSLWAHLQHPPRSTNIALAAQLLLMSQRGSKNNPREGQRLQLVGAAPTLRILCVPAASLHRGRGATVPLSHCPPAQGHASTHFPATPQLTWLCPLGKSLGCDGSPCELSTTLGWGAGDFSLLRETTQRPLVPNAAEETPEHGHGAQKGTTPSGPA